MNWLVSLVLNVFSSSSQWVPPSCSQYVPHVLAMFVNTFPITPPCLSSRKVYFPLLSQSINLLALPTEAKDIIVFRFIIEYSSLRDFYRPLGNK
jgi:hypothetical protein